jgi:hypothetical protein
MRVLLTLAALLLCSCDPSSKVEKLPLGRGELSPDEYYVMVKAGLEGDGIQVKQFSDVAGGIAIVTGVGGCAPIRSGLREGDAAIVDGVYVMCLEGKRIMWEMERK